MQVGDTREDPTPAPWSSQASKESKYSTGGTVPPGQTVQWRNTGKSEKKVQIRSI